MATTEHIADSILFVDDEASILSALKRELHDWARGKALTLLTAPSAYLGLQRLEEEPRSVAVVVSDLKMPEMLGSDFLLRIRERWPEIQTILLTGFSETQEIMKAVKAGISSYILKPWEPEYLIAELEKALASYHLRAQNAAYAKTMEEELRWAGEMQKAILRPNLLRSEGVEFRSSYRPVPGLYCGGDYYDVIGLSADRYLILVGDVAGHGVKAAMIAAILKAVIYPEYVRAAAGKKFSPAAFLSWLNDRMNFELRQTSGMIIAFFAGVLDRGAMTFTYANAGQPHPLILSGAGVRELPVSGSGLGFANSVLYTEKTEALGRGDIIFSYSDGLSEIGPESGSAPAPRIAETLASIPYGPDYHKSVLERILAESGAGDFTDDVTIVTARME